MTQTADWLRKANAAVSLREMPEKTFAKLLRGLAE